MTLTLTILEELKYCIREGGARVVCRQLGFESALAEFIGIDIKDENASIVMSNVACRGTEPALGSCSPTDGDDNCVDDTGAQAMCEPKKPTVTMSPKVLPSLVEGERLTLTCRANEVTKEIIWTKDDIPVNSRANIYPIGNNSTLVIENVLTSDSGRYSCEARNDAGSASSSVDITVTGNQQKTRDVN